METKKKSKNRFLTIFLAVLILVSTFTNLIPAKKVEAATINLTHQTGQFATRMDSNLYYPGLEMNIPSTAMNYLFEFYDYPRSGATFLTHGGLYTPQAATIWIEGQMGFCSNPTVLYQGGFFTNKISVTADYLDQTNFGGLINQFYFYRFPSPIVRERLEAHYGGRHVVQNFIIIVYMSGVLQNSKTTDATRNELYRLYKEAHPNADPKGLITPAILKSERYAALINWVYSIDNQVSVYEGGTYSLGEHAEIIKELSDFYLFARTAVRTGKFEIKEAYANTYYSPIIPNEVAQRSSKQVVSSYGGYIEFKPTGELELLKKSSRPDYTVGNNNYDLAGITFTVYEDAGLTKKVGDLVCDSEGKSNVLADLIAKDYWIKETKGGKGYHIDPNKSAEKVTVRPNERTVYETENIPIDDPVAVILEKQDNVTGKATKHGDASLALAEFTFKFYGGDYLDGFDPGAEGVKPTRTWVFRTDERGQVNFGFANRSFTFNGKNYPYKVSGDELYIDELGTPVLPLGTLTIQETKAPEGYLLPDPAPIHIRKIALNATLDDVRAYNVPVQPEQPILGSFTLFKGNENAEEAGIINPEEDAEFVAILARHVNQHGSFEEALKHLSTYEKNEYSVLVTDSKGNAKSGDLVYGDYLIMQTKGKEETHLYQKPLALTITEHGQTEHYNINNPNKEFLARIIKKDSVTGELVILNSASFKIKNKDTDQYVTMRVGTKTYDTFKTTSKNAGEIPAGTFYVDTEEPGTAVTPLKLKAGTYIVEEVETPEGYYLLEAPIEFKIGEQYVDEVDQDLDEIIEVVIENKPQYGELKLHKKGNLFKEWTTKSVKLPVEKPGQTEQVETKVPRANEALILTRDWIELKEVEELVEISPETVRPGKDAVIDPETGKELQPAIPEQKVPAVERLVKKKVEVPQQQSETVFTDETGSFSKDVTEKGTYTLADKDGKIMASLTLAKRETGTITVTLPVETKVDQNYLPGEVINQDFTYNVATYEEGYLPGAEFELKAKKDIKSYDGQTLFYKKGDKLQIAQKDIVVAGKTLYKKGEVITKPTLEQNILSNLTLVDTKVVTENKELVISRIPLGSYDLVETKAPKGYIKDSIARSFEFTPQAKTILVDLKETEPIINQRQKLNVFLTKTLKENEYFKDTDFSNIVIGMYTKETILDLAKDQLVAVVAPNNAGAITVNDIPEGSYYFKEISTKDGYILNTNEYDISIISDEIAEEDKIEVVKEPIVNEPLTKDIKVIKTDKDTGRPLVGVEFKLFKLEADGKKTPIKNTVTDTYSFFTDQKGEIIIKTLPFGTYSLEEVKTIDGYIKDKNTYNVAVSEDSELEVKVTNKVTTVGFRKINSKTGRPVVGSTLKLIDSKGNDVYIDELGYVTSKENGTLAEWITDGSLFFVKGLSIDHGYSVIEVNAPEGYHKGENLDFVVGGNTGIQLADYPNTPYEPKIKTNAFNKDTNGKTAHAIKSARIIDIIEYVDLIPGRTYKAKAVLVLADDPTQVITEASLEFVPETKDGEVEVDFGVVDLLGLAGKKVVVFESVIDLKTNLVVATHRDTEDPDQTLEIEDPELGTKARTNDGKDTIFPSANTIIIDTVSYKGLIVGEEYTVKGVLMDKASGEALLINGKEVRAEKTFIAETKDGTIELTFTFDSTDLEGKELVVFEELFYKGELIAKHKDINDPEQTIKVEKPTKPGKPVTNDDSTNPVFYLAGGSLLLLFAVLLIARLRIDKS